MTVPATKIRIVSIRICIDHQINIILILGTCHIAWCPGPMPKRRPDPRPCPPKISVSANYLIGSTNCGIYIEILISKFWEHIVQLCKVQGLSCGVLRCSECSDLGLLFCLVLLILFEIIDPQIQAMPVLPGQHTPNWPPSQHLTCFLRSFLEAF